MTKTIKYGDYVCTKWSTVSSIFDPTFDLWIQAVRPYLDGYELWVYGGVLEGWATDDIDGTIIGPYDSIHINWMLDNIVRVSLEMQLFPDIKYSLDGKLFRWSEWSATRKPVTCKYAYYKPELTLNNKLITWGTEENDLWVAERVWPMKKQLYSGHHYKDPILIKKGYLN